MEYLIGAIVAVASYIVLLRYTKSLYEIESSYRVNYSQSHVYELVKPALDVLPDMSPTISTQSKAYLKNVYMKIMVVQDKAYWIKDNKFMVAEIIDGEIDKSNSQEVDTMNMDKVELDEMIFIVEKLREGDDDSRGSGK